MKSTYEKCLTLLLAHEGGYTNHPSDPGGPTNFGITIHDYRSYVKPDATAADVREMNLAEAKSIYRRKYWDAQRCDELPAGIDYAVFDYGVNSGIGRSGKVLRRALHLPDNSCNVTDTVIGASRSADAKVLIAWICQERLRFLKSLKTWPVFGAGWARRVEEVRSAALAMATNEPVPGVPPVAAPGRAIAPAAKGTRNAAIVAVAVAATATLRQAGTSLAMVAGIVAAAVAATGGVWLLSHWRQRQQQHAPV